MMMNNDGDILNLGEQKEQELFEFLKSKFGAECVYHSPKYVKQDGQEKELSDIVILALPFAISIQMKWLHYSSDDIEGEKGEVIESRIIRRMENAAKQHKVFDVIKKKDDAIELPLVWAEDLDGKYKLPLKLIKRIIPIVIIDFPDRHYNDPNRRILLPPIVANAPVQLSGAGVVHAFLYPTFTEILGEMFSVGDLLLYISKREELVGGRRCFLPSYDELSIYALYLTQYETFCTLLKSDMVIMHEGGVYETCMQKFPSQIKKRRALFSENNLVDWVIGSLRKDACERLSQGEEVDVVAFNYDVCISRLKCLTSLLKCKVAEKIEYCLSQVCANNCPTCSSYVIGGEMVIAGQGIIISCVDKSVAEFVRDEAYIRANAYLRFFAAAQQYKDEIKLSEVLVIIFNKERSKMSIGVQELTEDVCENMMSVAETADLTMSLVKSRCSSDEWDYVLG